MLYCGEDVQVNPPKRFVCGDFDASAEKCVNVPNLPFHPQSQSQAVSKDIIMSRVGLAKYFGALGRLQSYVSLDGERRICLFRFFALCCLAAFVF